MGVAVPDIEVPHVSAPANRALHHAGIRTLQDLSQHSEMAIAALHGVGPRAMRVWADAMAQQGLQFAQSDAEGHPS
jgi:predicted flap endonuclease-1-like 5' DNA nuclease